MKILKITLLLILIATTVVSAENLSIPTHIKSSLNKFCIDCHDEDVQKGDFRLDNLSSLAADTRFEMLNKIEEQIFLMQMPPKKKKQLSDLEQKALLKWISGEFKSLNKKSDFRTKLNEPGYGNYVNHEELFSGEIKSAAFTPARRWIISPDIFRNRIKRIAGSNSFVQQQLRLQVKTPVNLPSESGVRYYDNQIVGGGHFATMLSNAKIISYAQLGTLPPEDIKRNEQIRKNPPKGRKSTAASGIKKVFEITYRKYKGRNPLKLITEKKSFPSDKEIEAAVNFQFSIVYQRPPSEREMNDCKNLTKAAIKEVGNVEGLRRMLVAVMLQPDFLYRTEYGSGPADQYGRKKLSPFEAAHAISYALTAKDPDSELLKAVEKGALKSQEDYARQIKRLLSINSREYMKVRFFREFFGYQEAHTIFKDSSRFEGPRYDLSMKAMINDADRMIEKILEKDKDVFKELLTTEKFYLYHNGDNKETLIAVEERKKKYQSLLKVLPSMSAAEFYKKNKRFLISLGYRGGTNKEKLKAFTDNWKLTDKRTPIVFQQLSKGHKVGPVDRTNMFNIDHRSWSYEVEQPFKIPNRKGMLTHPVWLVANSLNTSTDPVKRGKWIREKLLAGFIPEVPITVDAAIPEDHNRTLRDRLHGKTEAAECWKCHQNMNPLGYAFEMYDDLGRFRTSEELEYPEHLLSEKPKFHGGRLRYKSVPLDTTGYLQGTGDKSLDGPVKNALELIDRLGKSDRVRQSIIRHAFRYYMGRNEMLSDSKTLIDADQAYLKSGGSFNAVIVSLLTSDSFMYRK